MIFFNEYAAMYELGLFIIFLFLVFSSVLHIRKHRYMFSRLRHLEDDVSRLRDGVSKSEANAKIFARAQVRIFDALYNSKLTPRMPLSFKGQFGEDIIAYDFFRSKGLSKGFFIEAGAFNGIELSNTYVFDALGWNGLLIEPHPDFYEECRRNRPWSTVVQCALGDCAAAETITLTDAGVLSFTQADVEHISRCKHDHASLKIISVPLTRLDVLLGTIQPERAHFLSLDVEGAELSALRGFDIARWNPLLLVIEIEEHRPKDEIDSFLAKNGYAFAGRLIPGPNHFYVMNDDLTNPAFAVLSRN